jgi:hypothetical protein
MLSGGRPTTGSTTPSRLNGKHTGAIILIMHRLHEDGLIGHVQAQEDREVVRFPAIAEEDEIHRIDSLAGPRVFTRQRGETLHAEREQLAMLEQPRKTIGD